MKKFWEFFDAEKRKWPFRLAKFALLVIFFFGSGIYGFFHNLPESESPDFESREFRQMSEDSDEYLRKELAIAKEMEKNGKSYSPDQYFDALIALDSIFRAHGFTQNWKNIPQRGVGKLMQMMDAGMRSENASYNFQDVDIAANKYHDYLGEEKRQDNLTMDDVQSIGSWLFDVYLNCIIYAMLLFGIWVVEDRRILKFVRNNPLSLIINIVFYPLVIANIFFDRTKDSVRYHYGDAVIRSSQDKMFQLLKRDETDLIKSLVNEQLSIREIKTALTKAGYQPRRAIAFGLIVGLLIGFVPTRMLCQEDVSGGHAQKIFEVQKMLNTEKISDLKVVSETDDGMGMSFVRESKAVFEAEISLLLYLHYCKERFLVLRYQRKIFHIPVVNINYGF